MSLNILLVSDTMIKERTAVHGNIDPKLIYSDIKVAQDMYIHPILGSSLYNKLLTLINSTDIALTINANYKILLDKYLVDAIIYYTLSELPTTISYQFWNKGVMQRTDSNASTPSMSELIDLSNKYRHRAEFYATRMRDYLRQNAPVMYPEYLNPGNTVDTITPEQRAYTMPVYLGDDRHNPFCNPGGFTGQPYKP